MQTKFSDFINRRDLTVFIDNSINVLENAGINPESFYQVIIENPEILEKESEEIVNELLGWIPDALKSAGSAMTGVGGGYRAKQWQNKIDKLKNATPDELAKRGLTPDVIKQFEKERDKEVAGSQGGFGGRFGQAWKQARDDRSWGDIQAAAGVNPYRVGSQQQPQSPQQNPTPPPPQQNQPAAQAAGIDADQLAQHIQKIFSGQKRWSNAAIIQQLQKVINQLQQKPTP